MLAGIIWPGIFLALLLGQAGGAVLCLVSGGLLRLIAVVEAPLLYLFAMVAREDECGCDAHDWTCVKVFGKARGSDRVDDGK